jgi:UDP-N-acetylglucosamine:LPS N-acetylglucosamine transferase
VCGKNEHLLRVLTAEKRTLEDKAHRLLGIHVLGFVGNIDEWMVTSDLLVTKAWKHSQKYSVGVGLPWLLVGLFYSLPRPRHILTSKLLYTVTLSSQ